MNENYTNEMVQFRRQIHKRPEEGWTEFETMNIVVKRLRELGFKVEMGTKAINPKFVMGRDPELVAKAMQRAKEHGVSQEFLDETEGYTGCVGIWETGRPGPVTMFRHDMDCVIVQETNDPKHESNVGHYCSERDGLMHACGHDAHTSVGLGVAHWIVDHKDELCGTIKLLFQPAEEGTRGGLPMSESGLRLCVEVVNQSVQFPVQCPVAAAQAVGVRFHFRCLSLLQGYQAVAELVQFLGGGKHMYGLFASEEPCDAFFLLRDGAHAGGTFRHFGKVVHQKTVRFPLPLHRFHDVQQMLFLVSQ